LFSGKIRKEGLGMELSGRRLAYMLEDLGLNFGTATKKKGGGWN
jgi:hypothetical protein